MISNFKCKRIKSRLRDNFTLGTQAIFLSPFFDIFAVFISGTFVQFSAAFDQFVPIPSLLCQPKFWRKERFRWKRENGRQRQYCGISFFLRRHVCCRGLLFRQTNLGRPIFASNHIFPSLEGEKKERWLLMPAWVWERDTERERVSTFPT